ncbi:hypothetical protein [Streptomyces pakalii]|uniref:MarR family transcriptional regulator n=1 Tax=Streptomyces pakalii TaxID=3036494 RepID=A0ABT7DKL2_9ACTN|nr:hypothetical protein [Streptomyces pakalii]MDJ1645394.1 hypothetical protein [Streptomyces pakalii]
MTLNSDERELLRRISEADGPVEPSDYFHSIYPPDFPASAAEDDPRREAWTELQLNLYRAYIRLHEVGLIRVVHPANGERGDLVVATDASRDVLA